MFNSRAVGVGGGSNFFPTELSESTFFAVCELLNFTSLENTRTQVQGRNCALPVRFCLVQLCQSELSRSATSSTGEKGHFLFLNRNIVNPAKKRQNNLFAVSGVLVEFRTQGNGSCTSANRNFLFQFQKQKFENVQNLGPYGTSLSFLTDFSLFLAFGSCFFENFGFELGYSISMKKKLKI